MPERVTEKKPLRAHIGQPSQVYDIAGASARVFRTLASILLTVHLSSVPQLV